MADVLKLESTLTDRYQTTVPETVRRVLNLGKRDKIRYSIRPGGEVVLTRAVPDEQDEDDPVLGLFLDFLARDIAQHPERLRPLDPALMRSIDALVGHIEVDLEQPLSPDDD
jgi:antitoxin PrlF